MNCRGYVKRIMLRIPIKAYKIYIFLEQVKMERGVPERKGVCT